MSTNLTTSNVGAVATPSAPASKPNRGKQSLKTGASTVTEALQSVTGGARSDALAAAALMGVVSLLILPVPPLALDMLLAISLCIAVMVLMTAVYMERPVEFSAFPTLLLMVTLFRLTLNVASTRLILLHGHEGAGAVGAIIQAFGNFVAGGDMIVGLVIFLILVLINFIVITKGSGRIAEVAARFTLDALPGKQMSIDADLNAGIIGEEEAKDRRRTVEQEADFYGAMDGASKFVRGDAIAGLVVTGINLVGGILIGILNRGVSVSEALSSYAILTIGDGLVSQLPALIISTAAGVIVSRAAGRGRFGGDIGQQVLSNPRPLYMTAGLLGILALIPGLPAPPLLALGGGVFWLARNALHEDAARSTKEEAQDGEEQVADQEQPVEELLHVETLELEVGYQLVPLVDSGHPNSLMARISGIRRQMAQTLGILLPSVRVRDNLQIEANEYVLHLRTVPVARGEVQMGKLLAIDPGTALSTIEGVATKEPAFGLDAVWIDESQRDEAEALGYTTVDPSTVIATHIGEELRRHAHELIGRHELQELLTALGKTHQRLVDELVPKQVPPTELLRVLRALLEEQVPIRDLRTILETLADLLPDTKDTAVLADAVRQRMSASLTHRLADGSQQVHAFFLEPHLEQLLRQAFNGGGPDAAQLDGDALRRLLANFEQAASDSARSGHQPVVIVAPDIRRQVRELIARFLPNMSVLSHREVDGQMEVRSLGRISL